MAVVLKLTKSIHPAWAPAHRPTNSGKIASANWFDLSLDLEITGNEQNLLPIIQVVRDVQRQDLEKEAYPIQTQPNNNLMKALILL
ncbi:MAG: hypothetical protein V7L26_00065 [Nostoc sp.]|uniref:hypothetical protein n=1 Tax=Nostoc sp. TaxID=1180 RepID=UPI002FF0367D